MSFPGDNLPSSASRINEYICIRDDQDSNIRMVLIHGQALMHYCIGNREDELFAMGMLAYSGMARIKDITRAFNRHRNVVRQARDRLSQGGIAALVGERSGRKPGAIKIRPRVYKRIVELKAAGHSNRIIAARFGLSESGIRSALKREGYHSSVDVEQGEISLKGASDSTVSECVKDGMSLEEDASIKGAVSEADAAVVGTIDEVSRPVAEATSPRSMERLLASLGKLDEARSEFVPGRNLRFMGAFLAVGVLGSLPVWDCVKGVYGQLRNGFYGLQSLVLTLFLMSILRIKRVEHLKGVPPEALGRLLGLDRSPEMKTVRRKLNEIAAFGKSHELISQLARRFSAADPEALGFLYVDGHVRAYHGSRTTSKDYVTSRRLSMPASTDYWLNDSAGEPLFVVTSELNKKLTQVLPGLLNEVRGIVGERRVTIIFDRGGWSVSVFKKILEMGFDFMTYRKGKYRKFPLHSFRNYRVDRGSGFEDWSLADKRIRLNSLGLIRCVAKFRSDGRQTHIVTTRKDLKPEEVAVRMFDRWRQENFFKYMKAEFALDALVSYDFNEVDDSRMVKNSKVKELDKQRKILKKELAALEESYGAKALENSEGQHRTMRGFKISNSKLGKSIVAVKDKLARLKIRRKALPKELPLKEAMSERKLVALEVERRRFVDAIKIAGYRTETLLLRLLCPHYKRNKDEGRSLLKEIFKASGDIEIREGNLMITLEPLSSAHRTRALEKLSEDLNAMNLRYPEHRLGLKFGVRKPQSALN